MKKRKWSVTAMTVYGLLAAGIAFNGVRAALAPQASGRGYRTVDVTGNVERPGTYRVPGGSTYFEVLKVAGVRPTSDLTVLDLASQVVGGENLKVKSLSGPVGLKGSAARVALEYHVGELTIVNREGQSRAIQDGMHIEEGDRLLTEARSQAEFSIGTYSRIDVDDFTELTFDKIGGTQADKSVVEVFQKSGVCWYKIAYADKSEMARIVTPLATTTVGGTGADYMMDVKFGEVVMHCLSGVVLVERTGGEETVNLVAGQTVSIFSDGRPFQVRALAADVSPRDRFSRLVRQETQQKTEEVVSQEPLNIVIYGVPSAYFFVSVRFDEGIVHLVDLPANTAVDQFVQGVSTLSQALLQMGPVLTATLVENVMDSRNVKYWMVGRDDVVRIAAALGNVTVNVDTRAAAAMRLRPGRQKLTGEQLVEYMNPGVSGISESRRRQMEVLRAVFESLQSKGTVLTALLANQILGGTETSLTPGDLLREYDRFGERKSWTFRTHGLPGHEVTRELQTCFEPELELCKTLLSAEK